MTFSLLNVLARLFPATVDLANSRPNVTESAGY